jgi:putative oxidoreductase
MTHLLAELTPASANLAWLVLRITIGVMMFTHGYQKIFLGGRIDGTAGWFTSMGMTGNGRVHAWTAALTETGTGVLMVLGLITPFAAAGIIGIMFVAFWTHRTKWFVFKEGVEYNVVVAVTVTVIATFGGGEWSLDHALGWMDGFSGWTGMLIAVLLGIGGAALQLAVFYRPGRVAAAH